MATILWGIFIVLLSALLAVAGLTLVHRLVPLPLRESATTTTGIIYAALYVMYGVTLAFSLFFARQELTDAQTTTEREAASLEGLYQLAERFPEPKRDQIQELAESYARAVVEEEWPSLGQDRASQGSPRAEALDEQLQESIKDFEPGTSAEQTLYAEGLRLVHELEDDRELRLLESRRGIPTILWIVLVAGGILTVAYTFLFGTQALWLHRVAVAALAMLIALILYAIYQIQYPFTGDVRVEPEAFEQVLYKMEGAANNEERSFGS